MSREVYAEGLVLLAEMQRKLEYPPKRKLIKSLVDELVKKSRLRHDIRESYFRLLATCALLGKEPMYNSFKPRKRRVNEEARKEAIEKAKAREQESSRESESERIESKKRSKTSTKRTRHGHHSSKRK